MSNIKLTNNSRGVILLLACVIIMSCIFTLTTDLCSDAALEALRICTYSVVPSLFPFMVLSGIACELASRLTADSSRAAVFTVAILGVLCGFPIGASVATTMYKKGALSPKKAELVAGFFNNASPAFAVDVIGRMFWHSCALGWVFYICQILSSIFMFGVWRIFFADVSAGSADGRRNRSDAIRSQNASAADIFCDSVGSGAVTVVKVCGYIVFFHVVLSLFEAMFSYLGLPQIFSVLISAFAEFTSGASAAASLGGNVGALICAFSVGFSGISVLAQSAGILASASLSPAPMVKVKLLCGVLSSFLTYIAIHSAKTLIPIKVSADVGARTRPLGVHTILSFSLLSAGLTLYLLRRYLTSEQNT